MNALACSLRNLKPLMELFGLTTCSHAILVANILGFGALLIVLFFGYMTYRQKAKVYWQREAKLRQLLDQGNDEWEVPRASVVINRQIGEGAFGIVNGGDAQFEVDGQLGRRGKWGWGWLKKKGGSGV